MYRTHWRIFCCVFHKLHNLLLHKTTPTCEAMPIDTTEEPQTEKDDFKSESTTINGDVVENLKQNLKTI